MTTSKWITMFNSLVDFKQAYGHLIVPGDIKGYELLFIWANKQKEVYQEGELDDEKVLLLRSVGFQFKPKISTKY